MTPSSKARLAALLLASGVTAAALALGACAKKINTVEAGFTPEGQTAAIAQMVVWYEGSTRLEIYRDSPPTGPFRDETCGLLSPVSGSQIDTLDHFEEYRPAPATQIHGMIIDGTAASGYRLLRREPGGGYGEFQDFTLHPLRRWLGSQWEVYHFTDANPSNYLPSTYLGRGIVAGTITTGTPLTNPAVAHLDAVADLAYTGSCNPADSLFTLTWSAVPGAVRYWMHVYRFSQPPSVAQLLESSLPAPLNEILSSDVFVGFVDSTHGAGDVVVPPATSYRLGDTSRRDVHILLQRTMGYVEYHVRIAAVDSLGQLLAVTRGDYGLIPGAGQYALFRLRAAIVAPRRRALAAGEQALPPIVQAIDREGRFFRRR